MDVELRFMVPSEKESILAIAKKDPVGRDMQAVWTRYDLWQDNPLIVAFLKGELVGYHAATWSKSLPKYINTMGHQVLPEYRRNGIAKTMLDFVLTEGARRGSTRMRFRCHIGGSGQAFYESFGVKPIGTNGHDFFYDLTLRSKTVYVHDCESLAFFASHLNDDPIPPGKLRLYKRMQVRPID